MSHQAYITVTDMGKRILWLGAGWLFTGLGMLGVAVPLLPTTPFLLLALWAFLKSSPRLARRLMRHPRYGPILRAWIRHKAIPSSAKKLASGMLALSWGTLWLGGIRWEALVFLGFFFLGIATFVWSRPEGRRSACRASNSQSPMPQG